MSVLYGAVDLGKPERQEFFQEARADLKQAQLLKTAKDEQEKRSVAAAGNIPLVSSANMWDSHAKAAQKAAKELRGRKDEMMKTEEGREQYQTMINELEYFIEQGKDHFKTTSPVLENNINIARQGGQYENRMRDEHGVDWYEGRMAEADSDLYDVSFVDGHLMIGGMTVDDPTLMDNSRFDARLVRMEPIEPGTFWRNNIANKSQILDTKEAGLMVKDAILSNSRTQLDVAEWWRNSQGGVDESGNELPSAEDIVKNNQGLFEDAVDAYTEEAIEGWSPGKEKERKNKTNPKTKTVTASDKIMSDSSFSVAEEVNVRVDEAGNQTYVPEKTATLTWPSSNKVSVSAGGGESSVIKNIRFDGTTYLVVLSDGQEIVANKQIVKDGKPSNNPDYEDLARQVDAELGEKGAFDSMLRQLYSKQSS